MPQHQDSMTFSPFANFHMIIWLVMFLLAAATALFVTWQDNRYPKVANHITNLLDTLLLFTGKPALPEASRASLRISIGGWALGAMIISGLYSGTILITFVKSHVRPPFTSLQEIANCIEAKRCTLAVYVRTKYTYENYSLTATYMR